MLPFSTTKAPKAMILFKKISFDAASIPVSGEVWCSYASTCGKFNVSVTWFICSSKLFKAPFTRFRTNFCTDEFCSWNAVQILLQIAEVFTRGRANFKTVAAFEWLLYGSAVIGYR